MIGVVVNQHPPAQRCMEPTRLHRQKARRSGVRPMLRVNRVGIGFSMFWQFTEKLNAR